MPETPLPSREAAKHLGRMVLQGIDLNTDGQRDVSLFLEAIAEGRLVDREAIDYEAAMIEFKKFWDHPFASAEADTAVMRLVIAAAIGEA